LSDLLDQISAALTLPRDLLEDALAQSFYRYKKIYVKKRSGGMRIMLQPAAELKPIMIWLEKNVFSKLAISDISYAFQRGRSIVDNAFVHRNSLYSIRVDIKDFFLSIDFCDLQNVINESRDVFRDFSDFQDLFDLIRKACFDKDGRLPIGYLTSPRIANAVMFDIDQLLVGRLKDKGRFGDCVLTRYADDFVFSTDKRGACKEFLKEIKIVLSNASNPKLALNEAKTRYMSRGGGSTLITGLRVKQNSEIGVHPNYRDHVRLLMKLYSSGTLRDEDVPRLIGHLAFVEHADPKLFTRLSFSYFDEICRLRS